MAVKLLQRIKLVQAVINDDNTKERISTAAAFRVIAELKQRIFSDGLATDGTLIGTYSTTPYYQNPINLIGVSTSGVKPEGKNGQSVFLNGKAKKTKYLAEGYSELRQLTGRQNATVDLNFSGSVFNSLQVGVRNGRAVIEFTNTESAEILEANETRFGKNIIEPSEQEREAGREAASLEIQAILDEL